MIEIFNISAGTNVAKTKPISKSDIEVASSGEKSSTKDFLSIMFAQIKESIALSKNEKANIILDPSIVIYENTILDEKGAKKSVSTHLLDNLLKIITILKNPNTKAPSFPSFSNNFTKLVNSETALKELKGINNITDLLKLSVKYSLGLEKISVKNIDLEALKKEFPLLAKKEFFVPIKIDSIKGEKVLADIKKEVEVKPAVLSINNIEKPKLEVKKEPTLFEKIMNSSRDEKREVASTNKEIIKDKVVDEKKENISIKITEETKKSIKVVQEEAPKTTVKLESSELTKVGVVKENSELTKVGVVKENSGINTTEVVRTNEIRVEPNIVKKGLIESVLQNIKTEKQTPALKADFIQKSDNSEPKTELASSRVDIKPQLRPDSLSLRPTRETFSSFAAEFRERVESYKPPLMRMQLALNPKGMGEVDVLIINRGNNLHVSISSNLNTMMLFTQNQAEFKNSLVNMGFTNLEMNFSNQKESKEQQSSNKTSQESSGASKDDDTEEDTTSIEVILPQYV